MRGIVFISLVLLFALFPLAAQDSFAEQNFGFGFDDEGAGDTVNGMPLAVSIGGEVSASLLGYVDDFSKGAGDTRLGDVFSGRLNFSAAASRAEGVINLKLAPGLVYYDEKSPVYIDEAYLRAWFGKFDIEAGLRKLSWGKADSPGPLDVINPLDSAGIYQEMADSNDSMDAKIARPLVRASLILGQFSKLEGVFVPVFEPYRFARKGDRWRPAQMARLDQLGGPITPDTSTLDYAQAGLRFTTTIGGMADIGAQYYYGRLPRPAVKIIPSSSVEFLYNPYHQIGVDYAQVIYGFNIRAELAANITEDLKGDDPLVYNPALAWSLGFDRNLFLGITLNVQADETLRLMDGEVGNAGPGDIEDGTDRTATRITASLSRKFLRDELELRAAVVWGIEDKDCLIMPALIWTKGDVEIACSGGFFTGDKAGQLGQYHDNNFIKIGVTYSF
jgi:hypothetical protein